MIRYQEEEVELNDIGHFRVELDLTEELHQIEFCLEVELMFSDLVTHGGPEKFQSSSSLREIDQSVEFRTVSMRRYTLRRIAEGIFEYVPIVFEEQHFCVSLCTVHSSLLNF